MGSQQLQQHYRVMRKGGLRLSELQGTAREAWRLMRAEGSSAHADALASGIDVQRLPGHLRAAVSIRPDGAGIVTVESVVVAFIGGAAWDVWRHVLLPHIRRKWGDQALQQVARKASIRSGRPKVTRKKALKKKPVRRG